MRFMRKSEFKAVAIGASAGGVEALNTIFESLPRKFSLPIVVVLHVQAGADLIPGAFRVPPGFVCKEADDKESLHPQTIYFAPSSYHLLVEPDLSFSLSAEAPVRFARPSIDVFFESAAFALGTEVMGVLLTGANDDGAEGLKKIHDSGGFTIVQTPESASSKTMPQSALDKFRPNLILTPREISEFLDGLA